MLKWYMSLQEDTILPLIFQFGINQADNVTFYYI